MINKRIKKYCFVERLRFLMGCLCLSTSLLSSPAASAQSFEAQQLLLNWEKLQQLKNILTDMEKGYQTLSQGYRRVKDIANGNFSLHEAFLDGLLAVSPGVKNYRRIPEILAQQKRIALEYRAAFGKFKDSGSFSAAELAYLSRVYEGLLEQSLDHLDELATIITSSKLRMSDEERLAAIDRIFAQTQDKLSFLRDFNREAFLLSLQRKKEQGEWQTLKSLYP